MFDLRHIKISDIRPEVALVGLDPIPELVLRLFQPFMNSNEEDDWENGLKRQ